MLLEVSGLLEVQKVFANAKFLIIAAHEAGTIKLDSKIEIELVPAHIFAVKRSSNLIKH